MAPTDVNIVNTPIVKLQPQLPTPDDSTGFVAFYEMVRLASDALSFRNYSNFVNAIFCPPNPSAYGAGRRWEECFSNYDEVALSCDRFCFNGLRAYDQIREATDLFIASQAAMTEACCTHDIDAGELAEVEQLNQNIQAIETRMRSQAQGLSAPNEAADQDAQRLAQSRNQLEFLRKRIEERKNNPLNFCCRSEQEIGQRFRTNYLKSSLLELAKKLYNKPESAGTHCLDAKEFAEYPYGFKGSLNKKTVMAGQAAAGPVNNEDEAMKLVMTFMQQLRENQEGVPLKDCTLGTGNCTGILLCKLRCPPLLELIWSYWMEQGMLVQGLNALTLRYQNRRPIGRDPLTRCDISPLRPLNNIFWGYVQRENDRLSVVRRAYEYDHHYGLRLEGAAIPRLNPADSRMQFIEAFHRLLGEANRYYRTSMDTTMNADGFPILNSLRELHLVLAEGAHNQFGDLPTTARAEMLMQQWIIARPEVRDFLGGRPGVPYPERWMPHMESLRHMMGWNDTTIRHYRDLATYGERLLLAVRYLPWSTITDGEVAKRWAEFWRAEVQAYLHSYRAVTGVDLGIDDVRLVQSGVHLLQPSDLIRRRRAAMVHTFAG
jgi:hypothetical protein